MKISSIYFKEKMLEKLVGQEVEILDTFKDVPSFLHWFEKGKEKPDLVLFNAAGIYEEAPLWKKDVDDKVLDLLVELRSGIKELPCKVIFPMDKSSDTMLLINLLGNDYLDFWFCEELDKGFMDQILNTVRNKEQVEKYINALPLPQEYYLENEEKSGIEEVKTLYQKFTKSLEKKSQTVKIPEFSLPKPSFISNRSSIKTKDELISGGKDTLLFYSREDPLLCYSTAVFTALYLSAQNRKILLVELPGSGSRLGQSLGIRSHSFHLKNLIGEIKEKKAGALAEHCFSPAILKNDEGYLDKNPYLKKYPGTLYFLPDFYTDYREFKEVWPSLSLLIMKEAFLEMDFSYVFYVYSGEKEEVAEQLKPGRVVLDCIHSWPYGIGEELRLGGKAGFRLIPVLNPLGGEFGEKELRRLNLSSFTAPSSLILDFYDLMYFKKSPLEMREDTKIFVKSLYERVCL